MCREVDLKDTTFQYEIRFKEDKSVMDKNAV